jgi:hypothetical protein
MEKNIIKSDYVHVVKNVFSDDLQNELKVSSDKHFKYNLLHADAIEVTKCIIDCHGLALSSSSYFPYDERCWNIFCLRVKHHVLEYFIVVGVDESLIVPHSCWGERSATKPNSIFSVINFESSIFQDDFGLVDDDWLKKHMIRTVYYLRNDNVHMGTDIKIGNKIKSIPGEQNSLVIFNGGSYPCSNKFLINSDFIKYNIVFDWYINIPFGVPDWVLP